MSLQPARVRRLAGPVALLATVLLVLLHAVAWAVPPEPLHLPGIQDGADYDSLIQPLVFALAGVPVARVMAGTPADPSPHYGDVYVAPHARPLRRRPRRPERFLGQPGCPELAQGFWSHSPAVYVNLLGIMGVALRRSSRADYVCRVEGQPTSETITTLRMAS